MIRQYRSILGRMMTFISNPFPPIGTIGGKNYIVAVKSNKMAFFIKFL